MITLCAAFLVGMFAISLAHIHPAAEHQHDASDEHDHPPLLHGPFPGSRDSNPDPNVAHDDHWPDETTAIYLSFRSVAPKAPNAEPGMPVVIVGDGDDPALRSILELSRVSQSRTSPYLIGPSLRGPPAA